ncbi:MAG: DapH/DapD/GlmU-related protein [Promethearchaeota archaeon]
MSVPNTMRIGPFLPTILLRKRYLTFYIIIIWGSLIPLFLEFWFYWKFLWDYSRPIHFYTFLPLLIIPMYVTLVLTAIFWAKIVLFFVNLFHKPREGVFLRHYLDKDYRYWCIRNVVKRWPFWLSHRFPFPFMDNVCFKVFGVKTKFSNSLFEGWVDTEFIEFGKNVVVGQGAIVQSSVIIGNLLIIRKTIIEDDVRIGSHSIVMPGTHVGKRCVLAANSVTTVGQNLKEGWIYVGIPAKEYKKNWFFMDGIKEKIGHVGDINEILEKYDKIYLKRIDKMKERRKLKKELKEREKIRWQRKPSEDNLDSIE